MRNLLRSREQGWSSQGRREWQSIEKKISLWGLDRISGNLDSRERMCLFEGQSIIIRDFRESVHSVDFGVSCVHAGHPGI